MADHPVRRALARAARRMRWSRVAAGAAWWLATVGALVLVLALADNWLRLPAALRLTGATAAAILAVVEFWRRVVRPLAERHSPERAAVAIEEALGRDDNLLINACQFESQPPPESQRPFLAAPLAAANAAVRALPLARLCQVRRLARWGAIALVVIGGWTAYRAAMPERCLNALMRLVAPLADVPPVGSVSLAIEPSGTIDVPEGAALTVRVQVGARGAANPPAPTLVWADGAAAVSAEAPTGEPASLTRGDDGAWTTTFPGVRRGFAFRAFCADSCSRSVAVRVVPAPKLADARLTIIPPDYLGEAPREQVLPGGVAAVIGSQLRLSARLDREVPSLAWKIGEDRIACARDGAAWVAEAVLASAASYELIVGDSVGSVVARGALALADDLAPTVELDGADTNALVLPGAELALRLRARDDHGLADLALTVRDGERPEAVEQVWRYLGPPGPGEVEERHRLVLDPARFAPGRAYAIAAVAHDQRGERGAGRSRALVVRIKAVVDIAAAGPAAGAIAALKEAIARQRQALALADNLVADVGAAAASGRLPGHRDAIADPQTKAQASARVARDDCQGRGDGATARALDLLAEAEMAAVLVDLARLADDPAQANPRLVSIRDRQRTILARLMALVGEASLRGTAPKANARGADADAIAVRAAAERLKDDLADFVKAQERIIAKSRALADAKPLDLSDDQAALLGELSEEQAKQAKFIDEKLTDFSRLPQQDFADSSLSDELNEVWQEVAGATKALAQKSVELAVPHEQSGLELAKTLEHNLERWLVARPDSLQWKMEEPLAGADVPVAELPRELEDIVGELLDDEEQMREDVEDFSSAWLDSMDKGAGWDAMDGPISNMSAKGVTGNLLPNENEIGGRSGEGRNGRSHGQMAEATADGKGGRETPTRLSPSPFESGSVQDSSKADNGGASGGGKVSGQGGEGLRGPVPAPLAERMKRLAGQQAQLRSQGEKVALALRQRRMTDGALESAVSAMREVEAAAERGDGGAIRQRYAEAVDALRAARDDIGDGAATLRHERIDLERSARADQLQQSRDAVPAGYEEMVGRYFTALAAETE
ncbi:MAG TPA: hypothetical protein VEL07_17180 [Planctomycetota bacterium]|nr:hypothetical protein [Planctomycetota bacterium]